MSESNVYTLHFMSVADAMRVFGLTARAIRFYEEKGLFSAGRNRLNARLFDAAACRRLAWIAKLRAAGVSLPDIRLVLNAEDRDGQGRSCALGMLEARRRAAEAELRQVNDIIADLDTLEALAPPRHFARRAAKSDRRNTEKSQAAVAS
jgi:DNA-binding transcriptional MerR regulator